MTTSADGSTLFVANFFFWHGLHHQYAKSTKQIRVSSCRSDRETEDRGGDGARPRRRNSLHAHDYGRNTVVTLDIETFEVKTLPVGKVAFRSVRRYQRPRYMFVANSCVDNNPSP